MQLDTTDFPIVRLHYNTAQSLRIDQVLSRLSELLAQARPFAFIATGGLGQADANVHDNRKVALWMRANKAEIVRLIQGHVQLVSDAAQADAAAEFAPTFFKFWGYPMLVAMTLAEAQRKAEELLAA